MEEDRRLMSSARSSANSSASEVTQALTYHNQVAISRAGISSSISSLYIYLVKEEHVRFTSREEKEFTLSCI